MEVSKLALQGKKKVLQMISHVPNISKAISFGKLSFTEKHGLFEACLSYSILNIASSYYFVHKVFYPTLGESDI